MFTNICKKKIFVTKSLLQPDEWDIASTTLDLTWAFHFEMMYARRRIIGSLQSQDLDGETQVWIHRYGMVGEWIDLS